MDPSDLNVSRVFDAFTGYQRTAALRAAVDIDLFTAVGAGADTLAALAERCGAAERGVRALANRLVVDGFLTKDGERYGLTPEAAVFLDRIVARLHRLDAHVPHRAHDQRPPSTR